MKFQDKPKVLMLGTFHFTNPGLDVVKNNVLDISTSESQLYLDSLAERLSALRPTRILVECAPTETKALNDRLGNYLKASTKLRLNEMEQIGFRIARLSSLNEIICFDEREVRWDGQKLMEELKRSPQIEERFQKAIEELKLDEERRHSQLNLREILIEYNQPELERINRSLYLLTNTIGAGANFAGADASASWWHRNFRMFANIQKHAQSGARLIVIVGQGHSSLIRNFIKDDSQIEHVDVLPFL